MESQVLRIIDANCNRISEGLRVLEDVSRFMLNNEHLSTEIRSVRHSMQKIIAPLGHSLLAQRNSDQDIGAEFAPSQRIQDMPSLVTANAKRIEEGLRVLEETAKLPWLSCLISADDFQRMRFAVYRIERVLTGMIERKISSSRIKGLYAILDTAMIGDRSAALCAALMIKGGATTIQLRDKTTTKSKLLSTALQLKKICSEAEALFIVNDHIDIALAVSADGIQIGPGDLPVATARKIIPIDMLIGYSAYSIADAVKAQHDGSDYIGIGAVFSTSTKKDVSVIGLDALHQARKAISIPLVAIGGINAENVNSIMSIGVDAAAVISALTNSDDIESATRLLVNSISLQMKTDG